MTMDWVSWLRDGVLPSTEQEYSGDRPFGASQAELLGLPVAVVVLPDDSVPVAPLQEEPPEPGPLPEDIVQPDSPGEELETPLAPETELEIFEDAADYPDTAADDEQRPEEVTVAEEEVPAIPGSEPERELPPEQATRPEELQPDEAWPDERQYEQVEEILFEKEKPVSAFTIPARPLYPVPVSSKEPEKRLLAADESPVGKKKSLAFLLVATIAIVAGLFFLPGESYEELLARADSAFQEEQYEEALLNYDKASGKSPLQVESLRRKALALEALDRKGEAVDAWYGCLQATPDSAEIHSHLGELFFSLGSLDKAHKSFQESIGLDPGEASPYFGLGTVYEAKGEIEKASEAFAKAHQIEPDRKDYEEARSRLQREIDAREEELRLQDTMAEQQLVMGIASLVAKEYDDAEAHFTRALDLVPREKRAMLGLAESKAAKGDLPGARIAYLEILDEYPDDAGAMEGLASLEAGEKEPLAADDQEKASSEDDVVKESPLADPAEEKHADAADTTEESPVETEITDDALVAEKEDDLLVPTTPPGETVDAIKAQKPADQPKIAVKTEQPQKEKEQAPIDRPARPEKPVTIETPVTKLPATQERKKPSPPPPPPLARDVGPSEVQSLRESRSFNVSREYTKAVEKATDALRIRESPEALSNLGFAHIGLGNYPAAFTAYWRRLLLSSKTHDPSMEPPAFLSAPFESARWKDIPTPDARNVPFPVETEPLFVVAGSGGDAIARVLTGKEYLFEALRINPAEKDAYLNLVLSYIQMNNQKTESGMIPALSFERENETALYLALLGHALYARGEKIRSAEFLNAASARASGETLRFVRSLESLSSSAEKN